MQILILLGGYSSERDVSYASGTAVARALAGRGHEVTGLDPATGRWLSGAAWYRDEHHIATVPPVAADPAEAARMTALSLADPRLRSFDTVFIALHGGAGEDGTVQTLLGIAGVHYTGSGPLSSGVAMHKDTSKRLFLQAGIPTPAWVYPQTDSLDVPGRLGLPLIVKPVAEGSTVGLSLVKTADQYAAALAKAGTDPLCEAFIPGRELSVPILGARALPPVEVRPQHEIYDYECKYTTGMTEYLCPAPLGEDAVEQLCALSGRAFEALGCRGYARVDFRLGTDGTPYCLEVNTLPGMTAHSLVPMAARAAGLDFAVLCEEICGLSLAPPL